ncbi:MAG: hypothetical protein QNJ54_37985 [Prochloraceae cyanobacterium]|nr:hypothetical protein [Prochloraceae cyanobacterium]
MEKAQSQADNLSPTKDNLTVISEQLPVISYMNSDGILRKKLYPSIANA